MIGQDTHLPHTLVPLALAVRLVRSGLSNRAAFPSCDVNALAALIASNVPIFEYFDDPNWFPRLVDVNPSRGFFRQGGAEFRFRDGRPSKRLLAMQAADVECVIDMLTHPEHALEIRAKALRCLSAKARHSSEIARQEAETLRTNALRARSRAANLCRAPRRVAAV